MSDPFEIMCGKQEELPDIIADRSTLQQWATCPHMARLCRDHGINAENALTRTGTEIHRILEEAFGYSKEPEEVADYVANELPKARPDVQPLVIAAARQIMRELLEMHVHRIMDVERQIDYELMPATRTRGRFVITTCLDVLLSGNDSLHVVDWKTGYKKRTGTDAQMDFQTQVIAFILLQMYPEINTIHFWYVETRWGTKAYARIERTGFFPHMPHTTMEEVMLARIMQATRFWLEDCDEAWPEPDKCTWCDAIMYCKYANPYAKHLRSNPKGFVDQMCVLEELLSRMKKYAKTCVRNKGPMVGTNCEFAWRPATQKFTPKLHKKEAPK